MRYPTRTGTNRRAGQKDDDGVTGAEYRAQNPASKPRRRKPCPIHNHNWECWRTLPPWFWRAVMAGHERFLWRGFWPSDQAKPVGWEYLSRDERRQLKFLRYAEWITRDEYLWIADLPWQIDKRRINGGRRRP